MSSKKKASTSSSSTKKKRTTPTIDMSGVQAAIQKLESATEASIKVVQAQTQAIEQQTNKIPHGDASTIIRIFEQGRESALDQAHRQHKDDRAPRVGESSQDARRQVEEEVPPAPMSRSAYVQQGHESATMSRPAFAQQGQELVAMDRPAYPQQGQAPAPTNRPAYVQQGREFPRDHEERAKSAGLPDYEQTRDRLPRRSATAVRDDDSPQTYDVYSQRKEEREAPMSQQLPPQVHRPHDHQRQEPPARIHAPAPSTLPHYNQRLSSGQRRRYPTEEHNEEENVRVRPLQPNNIRYYDRGMPVAQEDIEEEPILRRQETSSRHAKCDFWAMDKKHHMAQQQRIFVHHHHRANPDDPPPYPHSQPFLLPEPASRRCWDPPSPPAASFGAAVEKYTYFSETSGAPLSDEGAERAKAAGHEVARLAEAYESRRETLRQLMMTNLLPRRDRLASGARWVADKIEDWERAYARVDSETRRDTDDVLTRLRDVYNSRTAELTRASDQLRSEVELIDRLSLQISNNTDTTTRKPAMSMLGFIHRYAELCQEIEAASARPAPQVPEAEPDAVLPRELSERLEALSTNRGWAEAIDLKDEMIWELGERVKAAESKLAAEKELTDEYSKEIAHWVDLTRELQAELDRARSMLAANQKYTNDYAPHMVRIDTSPSQGSAAKYPARDNVTNSYREAEEGHQGGEDDHRRPSPRQVKEVEETNT